MCRANLAVEVEWRGGLLVVREPAAAMGHCSAFIRAENRSTWTRRCSWLELRVEAKRDTRSTTARLSTGQSGRSWQACTKCAATCPAAMIAATVTIAYAEPWHYRTREQGRWPAVRRAGPGDPPLALGETRRRRGRKTATPWLSFGLAAKDVAGRWGAKKR